MVEFYFSLCNQFMKYFWNLLWVPYAFLGSLSWLKRCIQKPTSIHSLGQRFQKAEWAPSFLPFATSLKKSEFTHKYAFSPTAWSLGFTIRDRLGGLFEKPDKRQMMLLSLHVWNFCTTTGFKGGSVYGRGAAGWITKSSETSGTWIRIWVLVLNWRTSTRTMDPG